MMRDWLGVCFGCLGSWLVTAVDWNGITLAAACTTSILTVLVTTVCGAQRVFKGRDGRLAEQHRRFKDKCEAMLARAKVCEECIEGKGTFVGQCNFTYRHKNCPKNNK